MKLKLHFDSVYVASEPVDFRKGMNTLAALVTDQFKLNPTDRSLYVFTNNRRDRIKCLFFDGTGFWLLYKVLVKGRFNWTINGDGAVSISSQQLEWLLAGLDIETGKAFRTYAPLYV